MRFTSADLVAQSFPVPQP